MDVDESFAEYVAARWSMLYRLAVLLVGEPDADDLTQVGLGHAYLAWPEVQESASADDAVKRILATTAVREWTQAPEASAASWPAASDRDRLWATITALPARQRAVLVLRHYERLSDGEIATIVKASPSTVAAEAGALEAGIDLAELREELADRAEGALVPLPPIEALVAQGHEARRKRARRATGRGVVAAAAVVAVLTLATAIQNGTSDPPHPSRPTPSAVEHPTFITSLPEGSHPQVAYSVRHFLYLPGGRGLDLEQRPAAIAQTPHWIYVSYLSGMIVRINLDTLDRESVVESSGGQLVSEPDGSRVAWLESAQGPATVHLESTDPADKVDESRTIPATLRCCDNPFQVDGITQDGELIASLPAESRVWVWDTTSDDPDGVREISGVGNGVVSQVTAHGFVVHYPPVQYAAGQIDDSAFLQVGEIAAIDADYSDPLGLRVVYTDDTGEIHVRDTQFRGRSRRSSSDIMMRLPLLDDGFADLRWEDDQHVLLDVYDETAPNGALVRCDVTDGACELADNLEGPHLLPH